MEQHPVPQHIASYEFRLVGDMTLKQFMQVAGGALLALLFYVLPLPGIIKWPFVFICGLAGTALAFMPIEDRPLSTWIAAFLKAIYSPTYYTKQELTTEDIFAPESEEVPITQVVVTPTGEKKAEAYLVSLPQNGQAVTTLETNEQSFLQKITSMFPYAPILKKQEVEAQKPRPNLVIETTPPPTQPSPMSTPKQETVHTVLPSIPIPAPTLHTPPPIEPLRSILQSNQTPVVQQQNPLAASNTPNVVVGQVVDENNNGVESAILEIRGADGRPTRALRTNKVGHFLTITPLQTGTYQIVTEKDSYEFETVQFTADNTIIKPITIRGRKLNTN